MNETGRKILDKINREIKKSKYGNYIPTYLFKCCIKDYCSKVEETYQQMINKGYAYVSKSGQATTLADGLIDGFTPFESADLSECMKFVERMADKAIYDYGKISNKDWILKYAFDGLLISEFREPTCLHWDVDKMALNKYHRIEQIINIVYKRESTQEKIEREKQAKAKEELIKENIRKELKAENMRKDLLKIGKYCVCFDEYLDWEEYDSGKVLNSAYGELQHSFIRFFNTKEEAEKFANFIAGHEWNNDGDILDYWECDFYAYTYKVTYCGKYNPKLHKGKVGLFHEEENI